MTKAISRTTEPSMTKSKLNLSRLMFALTIFSMVLSLNIEANFLHTHVSALTAIFYFVAIGKANNFNIPKSDFIFFLIAVVGGTIYGINMTASLLEGLSYGVGLIGGLCVGGWVFGGNYVEDLLIYLKLKK